MLGIPSTQDAYEMFGVDKQTAAQSSQQFAAGNVNKHAGNGALSQMIRMKTNEMTYAQSMGQQNAEKYVETDMRMDNVMGMDM